VVLRESGENEALQAVAMIQKGNVVDLTPSRAMSAAKLSCASPPHGRQHDSGRGHEIRDDHLDAGYRF